MSIDSIVSLTDDIVPGVGIGSLVIGHDIREDIIQHVELNQVDRRYWFELYDHTIQVRLGEQFSYNIASIEIGCGDKGMLLNRFCTGYPISRLVYEDGWVFSEADSGFVHVAVKNVVIGTDIDDPPLADLEDIVNKKVLIIFFYSDGFCVNVRFR